MAFLNAALTDAGEATLKAIELLNPRINKQSSASKLAIFDNLVRSVDEELVNLEIQVINQHNIQKRALFYWAELYVRQLEKGKPYTSLRRLSEYFSSMYKRPIFYSAGKFCHNMRALFFFQFQQMRHER